MADVIKQLEVVVDGGTPTTIEFDAKKLNGKADTDFVLASQLGMSSITSSPSTPEDETKYTTKGVPVLDPSGHILSTYLPSYVDDVLEYSSRGSFPATGESGKIYVALDTLRCYRWGGSTYAEISESLALGETATTAFDGERGKFAYDHALDGHNKAVTTDQASATLQRVKVSNEGHVIGVGTVPLSYTDKSADSKGSCTATLIGQLNIDGNTFNINIPVQIEGGVLKAYNSEAGAVERVLTETDLSWHEF